MSTRDQAVLTAEATRAAVAGKFGADGTRSGSVDGHRSVVTGPARRRRKCPCGCGTRATHIGLGDGIALMSGCQLSVHRWVRDGYDQDERGDEETTDDGD